MDDQRRQTLRASLQHELEVETQRASLGPQGRLKWLGEQLENYVERWLGFCEVPAIPMSSLLNDDLFAMIGIGAEVMTEELERWPEFAEAKASWGKFLAVLAAARERGDRLQVVQLRGALVEVRAMVALAQCAAGGMSQCGERSTSPRPSPPRRG